VTSPYNFIAFFIGQQVQEGWEPLFYAMHFLYRHDHTFTTRCWHNVLVHCVYVIQ